MLACGGRPSRRPAAALPTRRRRTSAGTRARDMRPAAGLAGGNRVPRYPPRGTWGLAKRGSPDRFRAAHQFGCARPHGVSPAPPIFRAPRGRLPRLPWPKARFVSPQREKDERRHSQQGDDGYDSRDSDCAWSGAAPSGDGSANWRFASAPRKQRRPCEGRQGSRSYLNQKRFRPRRETACVFFMLAGTLPPPRQQRAAGAHTAGIGARGEAERELNTSPPPAAGRMGD